MTSEARFNGVCSFSSSPLIVSENPNQSSFVFNHNQSFIPFSMISGTSVGLTTTNRPLFSTEDIEPERAKSMTFYCKSN